jgi:hypothetical protein
MKKIRYSLATIALLATLSALPLLQGMGLASLANTATSRHVTASSVVGQSTKSEAYKPNWPCPTAGSDC